MYYCMYVGVNGNLTWSALLFQLYIWSGNKLGSWCLHCWVTNTFPPLSDLANCWIWFYHSNISVLICFWHVFTRTIQMDTWENHSYPFSVVFALLGFYYEEILNLKFMRVMVVRTGRNWSHCFEDRKQRGER